MDSEKARKKGIEDYHSGVKFEDNPMRYGPLYILSAWWESGWQIAKRKDQEERAVEPTK